MFLFHYSNNKYPILKTLEKQKHITKDERHKEHDEYIAFKKKYKIFRPGYYYEHISFFLSPVPENITDYFPKDHYIWFKGNTVYEHKVELTSKIHFGYEIVEFPEKTKLMYDESLSDEMYFKLMSDLYLNNRYIDKGYEKFLSIIKDKELIKAQNEYFSKLKDRPNYDEIKYKYAATVPHVMLYPLTGTLNVKSVKEMTLK